MTVTFCDVRVTVGIGAISDGVDGRIALHSIVSDACKFRLNICMDQMRQWMQLMGGVDERCQ